MSLYQLKREGFLTVLSILLHKQVWRGGGGGGGAGAGQGLIQGTYLLQGRNQDFHRRGCQPFSGGADIQFCQIF